MTTTACAIDQSVAASHSALEIATITPGYAAVRAHRPLKGRMASRSALLGTSVLAGVFGLMSAEAIAQQYNLSSSGGFTDVSSSINVVTDAGAGNIRVILADGVQFVAAPGQYQLNPMTNQLQVSTDVLLGAYTGGAPVAAMQSSQAMMASQAFTPTVMSASYGAPTAGMTYQPQVFTAGQYASQPSIVGGYQMQPSAANYAYNAPVAPNLNPQATQYVPAYSAGAQMAQMPGSFGGGAPTTFGAQASFAPQGGFPMANPMPVTQAVPTAEIAAAPAAPVAAGGFMGLPTWALVGGGVVAAGAAVMASGALGGDGTSTTTSAASTTTSSNYTVSQQAFLSDPAVQAALNGTTVDADDDASDDSGSSSGTTTNSGGITITGGSGGSTTSDTSTTGASATISAGREDDTITGTSGDDTVTFEAAEDTEEFDELNLNGGEDTVIMQDMTTTVIPEELENVENVEVQVQANNKVLNMMNAGTSIENLSVDANSKNITIRNIGTIDTVAVSDAGTAMVTIEDLGNTHTVALTGSDQASISGGESMKINVNDVNHTTAEIEVASTTTETLSLRAVSGSNNAFDLNATGVTTLTLLGQGDLTINNDIGDGTLAGITAINGANANGSINLAVDDDTVATLTTGAGGDLIHIKGSATSATYATNDGNDIVEIDAFGSAATLNTGDGADKIELDIALTAAAQKIDGGDGIDTLEISKNVTAGDYDNIETLEISGGATAVDLGLFDSLNDIEIDTTAEVTLSNVDDDYDIETVDGAVVTFDVTPEDTVDLVASGDLTLTNTAAIALTELNINFVSSTTATLELLDDTNPNQFVTLTIEGNEASVTLDGAGFSATTSELTTFDASAAENPILAGSTGTDIDMPTITSFKTGDGDDMLYLSEVADNSIYDLGAGDDTIEVGSPGDTVRIYGRGGQDTIALDTGGGDVDAKIYFTSMNDFVSGSAETVTGFDSGSDDIVISISGVNSVTVENDTVQVAGVAAGVYVDETNDVIYVSDGTDLGVINVNGINDTDIELF